MRHCIVVAGATGAVGRCLAALLVADGWRVVGTTRFPHKAARLREIGVEPVVVDVFDAAALADATAAARPRVVMHQLTDLPPGLDPARMAEATAGNARIRDEGTRNLVMAAIRAGAERFVAQSVAFAYAAGVTPCDESQPLNVNAAGLPGVSARGVASLERQVLALPSAIVLRYGLLYGPHTGFDTPFGACSVHVDAAAKAAALAASSQATGVYNVAEDGGSVSSERAKRLLGWDAAWRRGQ